MSRCKACNAELIGSSREFMRHIKLETGEVIQVVEDLCLTCRSKVFSYSDPHDFDLIDALGIDADGYYGNTEEY